MLKRVAAPAFGCRRGYCCEEKRVTKQEVEEKNPPLNLKPVPPPAQRKAKVTLLTANHPSAHTAALSLKLNSGYVGELRLWDQSGSLRGVALELSLIPTSLRISSFIGEGQIQAALRGTDIVVVMGGSWGLPHESSADLFYKNAEQVREMANAVTVSAPRAMVGIAVPPITPNVAFFGEMQREQGSFCPNRLLGVLSMEEMRARSLTASRLGLPPGVISLQLTGAGTPHSFIPVISAASPGGQFLKAEVLEMTTIVQGMTEKIKDARDGKGPDMSAGVGVANFVRTVAKGLFSGKTAELSAVVRTSCLHGLPYLALPVRIGPSGILGTTGIPMLSHQEMRLLIKALPVISEDILIGETWAHASRQTALAAE